MLKKKFFYMWFYNNEKVGYGDHGTDRVREEQSLLHSCILIIIDQLTKQSIFISTVDMINASLLAKLFILHVFSKHGVPSHVTSDCGTEFVLFFCQNLGKALDMKLHFTSGYHLEGDRQTKCTNQTLEQ